ncbi:Intracellular growth attenuator protein igaA, partial [Escherichia coli]|nr:Intracellular growth attenuator protein igaA [Escherichia coli]
MSTILFFIAAMLACAMIAGWVYRRRAKRQYRLPFLNAFAGAGTRKLTAEERSAVDQYLDAFNRIQQTPGPTGASAAPVSLTLNAQSNTVLCVTRSITRYGITTDDPNKWRYYLDSAEVHLPPFWEQYINDENSVELIQTDSIPLVIALNGHTIGEYVQEAPRFALELS